MRTGKQLENWVQIHEELFAERIMGDLFVLSHLIFVFFEFIFNVFIRRYVLVLCRISAVDYRAG